MNTAMILAAGRGDRLKPVTDHQPKALCLVHNTPLIEHHINNLARTGFKRIVINHAYLGGHIRHHCGNGERFGVEICYSPEPPGGLETGGGIVNALPLLGSTPFITVNADIFTDFDFSQLKLEAVTHAHLILINKNPALNHHGDFGLTHENKLSNTPRDYTFSGIACYNPHIFHHAQQGRYSVIPLIRHQTEHNNVTAQVHQGVWFDVGSVERLQAANQRITHRG